MTVIWIQPFLIVNRRRTFVGDNLTVSNDTELIDVSEGSDIMYDIPLANITINGTKRKRGHPSLDKSRQFYRKNKQSKIIGNAESDTRKHEFRSIPAKQSGVYLNLDDTLFEV